MREAIPFVLLACACGAAARGATGARGPAPGTDGGGAGSAPPSHEGAESLAALAASGPTVALGMREVLRAESTGGRIEVVRAEARDTCVRVAFESTAPVTAKLTDRSANVLATSTASTRGVLGAHGPVCIRKGDTVSASADGEARVRWVVWQAP